jgi:hypothetical protein
VRRDLIGACTRFFCAARVDERSETELRDLQVDASASVVESA